MIQYNMKNNKTYGYVYIGHRHGLTKIGISSNPFARKRQIETASGISFECFFVFYTYANKACEKYLLGLCGDTRVDGEWFKDEDSSGISWMYKKLKSTCEEIYK